MDAPTIFLNNFPINTLLKCFLHHYPSLSVAVPSACKLPYIHSFSPLVTVNCWTWSFAKAGYVLSMYLCYITIFNFLFPFDWWHHQKVLLLTKQIFSCVTYHILVSSYCSVSNETTINLCSLRLNIIHILLSCMLSKFFFLFPYQ